ncbi:uncharacterized protein N7483_001767 [Penicillium malachiteum]|uniref:uncharacterized protein n=1 Tax=Penicillium malachiteum TaxID=1324776 RepID=UPI00254758E9|nr:uncharacterized protein N7483_001767 [Penicillium malachiteum]KAJ5736642.1 hypothetical protein N7483_001767 [Penicillium malachiteum]
MAPPRSFLYILSLVWTFTLLPLVLAAPWIVTQDYEQVIVTEYAYDDFYETADPTISTSIEQIIPTVTSLPVALSTITSIDEYSSVTIVQKLYPTSVGTPVPYDYGYYGYDDSTDDGYHMTVYVVNITYTAPTACSSGWTTASPVPVYPPYDIMDALPTTAMSTSLSVDNSEPFQPTTYTYDYIWVASTQIPSSSLSYLSLEYYPTSMYDMCGGYPTATATSTSDSSECEYGYCSYYPNYWDESDNWWFDSWEMGISPFALVMTLTFGWIGIWLIAGFIEAWVRFRRLMLGWQTRRGLPVSWAITILPLTLLLLIWFRKGFHARSEEDAAELRKQWDGLGFWKKLKLYFVWGFRFKYPTILGEAPPRVNPSKRPGKQQRESLLSPAGVPPVTEISRDGAVAADPELGQVPGDESSRATSEAQEQVPVQASGALDGNREGHHATGSDGQHDSDVGRAQ